MARTKGSFNLAGAIEPLAAASLDARATVATKADLTASGSFPYFYKGMETYVVAENKKYRFVGDDPTVLSDWEEVTGGGQEIQVEELPTPSESLEGAIYQYVGETDSDYTNGYFYECVSDGQDPATYSWVQTNVQPSGGSTGGGHTIEDSEGTDLTQRDILQFGEGFLAEDDDTNEKTVISPNVMQSGDMDDVLSTLPSVAPKKEGIKYSTTEQVIGEWIDGKPIYQKVVPCSITSGSRHWQTLATISDVDTFVFVYAIVSNYVLGGYWGSSANDYTGLTCDVSTGTVTTVVNGMATGDGFVIVRYTKTTD